MTDQTPQPKKFALVAFGNEESYGLLFVGGELLELGQTIRFFDAEETNCENAVADWAPDFACFSPMTTFYRGARELAGRLKARLPRLVTVFGGHHAMSRPEIADDAEVDAVVVGPARGAMARVLGGERGRIDSAPTTPDDLPAPAREAYYRDVPRMAGRYRKVMLSMLGCPWNCSYCSSAAGHLRDVFGAEAHRRYYLARRPVADILNEARVVKRHDTREIEWVDDDIFAGADADDWLLEFVGAWRREIDLPMYVSTTSRFALRISDRVLEALRPVVDVVGMGVQAIRPESLRLFNRAWDGEAQMKAAYARLRSFGYRVNLQAIVGLPVDDPVEDALDTLAGLRRLGPGSVCSIYPLMIYPGTAMERVCRERGFALNEDCEGDTNSAIPNIVFPPDVTRRLRNVCKLGTMLVKYGVDEHWTRALLDVDFDDEISRRLSLVRYRECVVDRLKDEGERIFNDILSSMRLRY